MKIAFIVRPNIYEIAGGDTVQIDQTAGQLRKLGVKVDILLSNAVIPYENYDLLNFFHITRSAAIMLHAKAAIKPFVVSTIHCPYGDYDKYTQKGLKALVANMSENSKDYLRTIYRWLRGKEGLPINYLWQGQRKTIIEVLRATDLILPNSVSELNRIRQNYYSEVKYRVVTNGINPEKFPFNADIKKDDKLIVCVGRIEKRKNQLNLIKALNNTDYKLVLIGAPTQAGDGYYQQCVEAAGKNVTFSNRVPHDELISYLQLAKVHVLASWFETTGLSSLEAAVMRCNIVITDKGDTRDYFGDEAFYCDPANPDSIKDAVDLASKAIFNNAFYEKIVTSHTWKKAAEQTLEAYNIVLKSHLVI